MSEDINPWTTLSSRVVYDNPWIRVDESQVLNPNGRPGLYGVVHMKHGATGVIPVDDDGTTVLVGQYRFALGRYSWEIVEGGAEEGEDFQAGAQRELAEEAGLVAARWQRLVRLDVSNSITDEVAEAFVAWDLRAVALAPDETEKLALRRLPVAEAVTMALDGGITDAISVAALLKLNALWHSGALPGELMRRLGRSPR